MRRFWIDTDTGSDDAVALVMALRRDDIQVDGLSIVAGNVPADIGSRNARYTVELCGADVPVFIGLDRPLVRESTYAWLYHGEGGMSGVDIPEPKRAAEAEHGVIALVDAAQ